VKGLKTRGGRKWKKKKAKAVLVVNKNARKTSFAKTNLEKHCKTRKSGGSLSTKGRGLAKKEQVVENTHQNSLVKQRGRKNGQGGGGEWTKKKRNNRVFAIERDGKKNNCQK